MRVKFFLFGFLFVLVGFVSADIISINAGGSEGLIVGAGKYIEGFFFGENSLPVVWDVFLSSTFGTNRSYENLSVSYLATDFDSDAITNITDWRLGGSSIARLNMPFDTRSSQNVVRDYSSYENNGSLGGGNLSKSPTWISDCPIGGCYSFDGVDDYIIVQDDNSLDVTSDISFSFWFYLRELDEIQMMVSHMSTAGTYGYGYEVQFFSSNRMVVTYNNGDSRIYAYSNKVWTPSDLNKWWHFVYVANESSQMVYINAEENLGDNYFTPNFIAGVPNTNLDIGLRLSWFGSPQRIFNGSIDDLQIFSRALTPLQVKEIYNSGNLGYNLEGIVFSETEVGDFWSVAVTPNDANGDGFTVLSNELEIINEEPESPELYLYSENGRNETDSDLICDVLLSDIEGDRLNLTLRWFRNDSQVFEYFLNNNYLNDSVLNFTLLQDNLSVGDVWRCEARSYDGYDYSDWGVSNSVTIVDITAPIITIISPEETNYSTIDVLFNVSVNEEASQCVYDLDYSGNVSMTRINSTDFWYWDNTMGPGPHDLYVYCSDLYGNWNYSFVNFTIDNEAAISIYLSSNLSWAVRWNIVSLPAVDLGAIGNNFESSTDYYINISAVNTFVDLYVRADGDLMTEDLDVIGLGNETFGFSYNDSTVSNVSLNTMSTDYVLIGDAMDNNSTIYMKFYLDAPTGQAAGVYLNQLDFKAVRHGEMP